MERQTGNALSLPFQKWPCGLSGAAAVAAAGCREAAARLAEDPCYEMSGPWSRSTAGRLLASAEGRGRERGGSESWRGTVTREQGAVVNLHLMPGAARLVSASVERRSWLAAGRCQWVLVRLHGEWADILWGGFYRWLCCRAMPCPHCLKGTESSERFFSSGFFWQVRGEEIGGTAGASSGSPCCQGVAFDLAAVHAKVFAKGLEIKKRKRRQ